MSVGRSEQESERTLQVWFRATWAQPAQVCCITDEDPAPTISSLKRKRQGQHWGHHTYRVDANWKPQRRILWLHCCMRITRKQLEWPHPGSNRTTARLWCATIFEELAANTWLLVVMITCSLLWNHKKALHYFFFHICRSTPQELLMWKLKECVCTFVRRTNSLFSLHSNYG